MDKLTVSVVISIALGLVTLLSADGVQTQLIEIENASITERSGLIQEFKYELKNMGEEQRIKAMHKIQEEMPELAQDIKNDNVEAKINEIKNAEPAERVKLMNRFKLELAQMKAEEQAEAITLMQKQMSAGQEPKKEQSKEQVRIQNKIQNEQMNQMQKTNAMEQMNQQQGAEQSHPDMTNFGNQPVPEGFGQH